MHAYFDLCIIKYFLNVTDNQLIINTYFCIYFFERIYDKAERE